MNYSQMTQNTRD